MIRERGLSFVVPAFNEESAIARLVAACHATGRDLLTHGDVNDYEIVIVDDGSTDSTGEICDVLATRDFRLKVVHHAHNRRLGAAIRTGTDASAGRYVLYTDADLPFDLSETRRALRYLRLYDAHVVAGYRLSRAGEGVRRMVYSYAYNALIRARFGIRVRDVNFAAKLIRREVLDEIELRSEGSFIDAEMLIRAERAGFRTVQFGLNYFPRSHGTSTLSSPRVIREILEEMFLLSPELRTPGCGPDA